MSGQRTPNEAAAPAPPTSRDEAEALFQELLLDFDGLDTGASLRWSRVLAIQTRMAAYREARDREIREHAKRWDDGAEVQATVQIRAEHAVYSTRRRRATKPKRTRTTEPRSSSRPAWVACITPPPCLPLQVVHAPRYRDELVTLFEGDARALAAELDLDEHTVLITDPVWPNPGRAPLRGADAPAELFADVMGTLAARGLGRAIVILGLDSDPRFLAAVPPSLPFVRATWLRFARPSYKGPVLNGAELAYVFGTWGMAYKGQKVWPGEIMATAPKEAWKTAHPCPRKLEHLVGLVRGYTRAGDHIVDLFAGSGTTVDAAARNRRRVTACEIEPAFCLEIAERARIATMQTDLGLDV